MEELPPYIVGDLTSEPLDPDTQGLFNQELLTEYNRNQNYPVHRIN